MGTLLLVRHGQASAFEDNYDRLSPLGERQAGLLGERWRRQGVRPDRVFSGPRVRQRRTAEIAAEVGGLPAPVVLEELDEMGVEPLFKELMPDLFARHAHLAALGDALLAADGDADRGRSIARLFEAVLLLWVEGRASAPEVEPWPAFRARVARALDAVLADARGQSVAVFTSAGPVAAAVQRALGTGDEQAVRLAFQVRNSSFSEFLFSDKRFSLASFNQTPHLEEASLVTVR
jgi:broad specificity phosphatase PhoE